MSKATPQHSKTQSLLLISKLLDCRENISPLTLILDSLSQSARPLVQELIIRAQHASTRTIFVAFESLRAPQEVNHYVRAWTLDAGSIQKEISRIVQAAPNFRYVVIIDTLHQLLSHPVHLPSYLTGLIAQGRPASSGSSDTPAASGWTSLVAVYHVDQPVPASVLSPYSPKPLTLLAHLATTVFTVHSPNHVSARRAARNRARAAPVFGLEESVEGYGQEAEGVLQGLGANDRHRIVIDGEVRRRSGRAVDVCFVLDWSPSTSKGSSRKEVMNNLPHKADVFLLQDHPLFQSKEIEGEAKQDTNVELGSVSFNLGLTEKQRRDREGVVLPYFDAQNESGDVGEGGRILYDMGIEDDFDEEEDEI